VAYFGVISRNFPGGYDENHEKLSEESYYYPGENFKLTSSKYTSEVLVFQTVFAVTITVITTLIVLCIKSYMVHCQRSNNGRK
jgi:hypothetical protein